MTQNKQEQKKSFNEKFAYGALANRFLQDEKTSKYAIGALDILAKEGLGLSEEAKGFIEGAYSSQKGIETTAQIYSKSFSDEIGKSKPYELSSWYSNILSNIEDKDRKSILSTLNKQTETVGEITKKAINAQYKVKAPEGMFNEEELTKAKNTLKDYNEFFQVTQTLDDYKFESLREKAINATRDKELKNLASVL